MGGKAVGLSGKDGNLISAKKLHIKYQEDSDKPPEIIDPGLVGQVTRINPDIINTLIKQDLSNRCPCWKRGSLERHSILTQIMLQKK